MKRPLLIFFILLISKLSFCQTPIQSFESHLSPNLQGFTKSQIDSFISKAPFENYRLRNRRDTLTFDNGFKIVLMSANEMAQLGLINNTSSYQEAFPANYKLPVFHLTPQGWVMAAYTPVDATKYKGR